MHPAPFVTHPIRNDEQEAFVSNVVGAIMHDFVEQLEVEFTIQPVSQVSEQEDSDYYYPQFLAEQLPSPVLNPHKFPLLS